VPLIAVALVAVVIVGTNQLVDSLGGNGAPVATSPSHSAVAPTAAPSPSCAPSASGATASSQPRTGFGLGYEPLWPFPRYAAAEVWRTGAGGSQPWHLDANQTVLAFAQGWPGSARSLE
jgi:hypothetical protein